MTTVAVGAVALAAGATSARAQTGALDQTGLFSQFLARPAEYATNAAYARKEAGDRDYEAAIVALERLLYFNPDLARVKYELATLYFRLKAYDMAARYLDEALASPGLDEDTRRKIEILQPTVRKELRPSRFYGVLQLGLGYNTNVPGVPGPGFVRSFGAEVANTGPFFAAGGAQAMLLGEITHIYDFENQRGDVWETRLSGVAAAQFRFGSLSSVLGEITTGPRLAIAPDALPGATIRPYVVASYGALSLGRVGSSVGVGVSARFPFGSTFHVEPGFEWRRLDVAATNQNLATVSLVNTGSLWTASLATHWSATDRLTFDAKAFYGRNVSYTGALSSRRIGLEGSARYEFDPPFAAIGWRWSVAPFVRYVETRFDAPDAVIDPLVARVDRQLKVGTQFDMPITPMLGVSALVQYTRNNSSLPNFRTSAWSGLIGPTLRF